MESRLLSDDQLAAFDWEHVSASQWRHFTACVDRDFPTGEFSVLDVGGGNGLFADRILTNFPRARVTVLDTSEMLLSRNRPLPNKEIKCGSALSLDKLD